MALKRFERWLNEHGYRDACINSYLRPIERLLKEMGSSNPTLEDAKLWHVDLAESKAGAQHGEHLGRGIKRVLQVTWFGAYPSLHEGEQQDTMLFQRRRSPSHLQLLHEPKALHHVELDVLVYAPGRRPD